MIDMKLVAKSDLIILAEKMRMVLRLLDSGHEDAALGQLGEAVEWGVMKALEAAPPADDATGDDSAGDASYDDPFGTEQWRYERDDLRRLLNELRAEVRARTVNPWHIEPLQKMLDGLDLEPFPAEERAAVEALAAEARAELGPAKLLACDLTIETMVDWNLVGVTSVRAVLDRAASVTKDLEALGALDEPRRLAIRRASERACRYRAVKKIDEAQVAEGGGNQKKGAKLRGEAAVMLQQDWKSAFPDEEPPLLT